MTIMINETYNNRLNLESVSYSNSAPQFSSSPKTRKGSHNELRIDSQALFEQLTSNHGSIFQIAERVITPLLSVKANKELCKTITKFQRKYQRELTTLKNHGWHSLCKKIEDDIVTPLPPHNLSFQDVRNSSNQLVNKVVYAIANILNLSKAKFKAYGTVGPFSDVDFSVTPSHKGATIPTEESVSYQCIRELVNIKLFGELSSKLFDTQSYIPHICTYGLQDNIFSTKVEHDFVTFEFLLCLLNAKILYRQHPERFNAICKKFINTQSATPRKNLLSIIKFVNDYQNYLNESICQQILRDHHKNDHPPDIKKSSEVSDILRKDPEAYKRAMFAYTIPIKIIIARKTQNYERKVKVYQTLLDAHKKYHHISIERFKRALEEAAMAFMIHYSILKSLEHEATLSSSEGVVTLEAEDSQKHKLHLQKAKRSFLKKSTSLPVIKRAASSIRTSHEKQLAIKLTSEKYKEPSIQALKIAAFEEVFQFDHLINQFLNPKDSKKAQKGAIISGKYAFRNTHNNLRALHQYRAEAIKEHRILTNEFIHLEQRTQNLAKTAKALEKCKRKQTLSKPVLLEFLTFKIWATRQSKDHPLLKGDIYHKLDKIFSKFDRLGSNIGNKYMDIRTNKRRLLNHVIQKLIKAELIETIPGTLTPKDTEVELLLRAWAGSNRLKKNNSDLLKLFEAQDNLTLMHYGLLNYEDVVAFREEIIRNEFEVLDFLLSERKIRMPVFREKPLNLLQIWKEAEKEAKALQKNQNKIFPL